MAHSRAEESVYVITFSGQFKGKGNSGSEAPKLRNDYRVETHEQRVYCAREKEIETTRYLKKYLHEIGVIYS